MKYYAKDAATAHAEWVRKQQEANEEYYYYEEDEDSSGDRIEYYDEDEEVQCRLCDGEEEERPRLFWNFMDITRRVPCCEDEDTRQAETTTMPSGPRMKNATRCGRKYYPRILGGVDTSENEFPWQCALLKPDMSWFGCSAVLLSCDPVIIVTAAHCFRDNASPDDVIVACGAYKIDVPDPSPRDKFEVRMKVKEIVTHPDFSWLRAHHPFLGDNDGHPVGVALFENDISVLKLEDDSELNCKRKKIWPACLPSVHENYVHWYKTGLAGWGLTLNEGNISNTLMKVNAPVVTDKTCQERVCNVNLGLVKIQNCIIAENHICAGGMSGRGPCRGDSGGALLAQDRDLQGWSAIGLVSYQPGIECGTDQYVVFTELRKFLPWIASNYGLLPPMT